MTTKILVGVCTFNEAGNIARMVSEIVAAVPSANVLVVDDDSPDQTASIVETLRESDQRVQLIVRSERGLGGAIQTAMRTAIDNDYDLFCNLDADFSHDPAILPQLIDKLLRDPSIDVAVGSRYVPGGGVQGWPWHRRSMSRLVNAFARMLLRMPVRDASGSYRCYRIAKLREVGIESTTSDGYAFIQEILLTLDRGGAKCVEVPIIYTERIAGSSKLDWREATRSVATLVGLFLRRA